MTSIGDADALNAALAEVDNLEESLLTGVELTHYGYTVQLQFEHLRRGEPGPDTHRVTIVMEAVSLLCVVGGLSATMIQQPEQIDWGLSEVALVSAYPTPSGVGVLLSWEGERQIRVEAARAHFNARPAD